MVTSGASCNAGVLQEAMEVFLYYVYKDELDTRLDAELAAAVLHIAQYYGAPRLAGLCERLLAREIKNGDPEDEGKQIFPSCEGLLSSVILCSSCASAVTGAAVFRV